MIYFSSSLYSKGNYARFRSSLAMEKFIASANTKNRAADLRWARAWQLAVNQKDRIGLQLEKPDYSNTFVGQKKAR